MANAVELAEKIAAVKESVTELSGRFASSKGQAEQMATLLAAMGIDGEAQKFQGVVEVCEEAESGRTVLEGGLTKAHWQVMSAVLGTMGPGARTSAAPGTDLAPGGPEIPPPASPTPAAPSSEPSDDAPASPEPESATKFDFVAGLDDEPRPDQLRYIANEPANLPEEIDPFDDSRLTSRPVRAVRVAARGVEDLQGGAKQVTTDIVNFQHFFDPPADNAYTESQPKDTGPQFTNDPPAATPLDPIQTVANVTAMSVAVAKVAVGQMRKRNR